MTEQQAKKIVRFGQLGTYHGELMEILDAMHAETLDVKENVLAMQSSVQELAVGMGSLSVKANEWVGVGTWGDTLSWPAGNVWPSGN